MAEHVMEPRKAGPFQVIRTVLLAFFGVRRGSGHERDSGALNPVHIIIAGIIGVALFVLTLVLLVRVITAH
jgi:hypothetical protein